MSTHTVQVDDVCGNTHIYRKVTLEEAHGKIGSFYPVIVDGRRGTFRFVSMKSTRVLFVESN